MSDDDLLRAELLVVDDEAANVRLLERMLGAAGFTRVSSTTDPRTVLPRFEGAGRPDLLLLDLLMPHLDGFEIMRRLQALLPAAEFFPILVLTADATEETKRLALSAGATDFLTKPFDPTEVILRVRNLLRTRGLHRELQDHNRRLQELVRRRTSRLEETVDKLYEADRARQRLLAHLVSAQEDERRRIAADIHDDSIQVMAAALMRLQVLRKQLIDPDDVAALDKLLEVVGESTRRLRKLLFDLRPPALDEEGLGPAVTELLARDEFADLRCAVDDRSSRALPVETRVIAYRIIQEAMTNVRKHARASNVRVCLDQQDDRLLVTIEDDGVGFDPEQAFVPRPGHLGLLSMRERAEMARGSLRVDSASGKGTRLLVELPAAAPRDAG